MPLSVDESKKAEVLKKKSKISGVEFQGIMCSATEADQNGLAAIRPEIESGTAIPPFVFENGNKLQLTQTNWEAFRAVWLPFRMSFFE